MVVTVEDKSLTKILQKLILVKSLSESIFEQKLVSVICEINTC